MFSSLHFILYLVIAVLMVLVIVFFVIFVVAFRCKKRKENEPSWVRSVSIEHLEFAPRGMEERRNRANIPIYENQILFDFTQRQNIRGTTFPASVNPSDIVFNCTEVQETNKSKYVFRTFNQEKVEPKIIYWETRI